jgi:hypothetical protein
MFFLGVISRRSICFGGDPNCIDRPATGACPDEHS